MTRPMSVPPEKRRPQLAYLFQKQGGRCFICGEQAVLDFNGDKAGHPLSAVRFRRGSKYGKPGRFRPRVMAHRKCADQRSREIELSISIEERHARAGHGGEDQYVFCIPGEAAESENIL